MEQINKVELRGLVGGVKLQEVGGKRVARFTLATSIAYTDRSGTANIETQWHNINAWEGKNITCLDEIHKGSKVQVQGRIRYSKFTGSDQSEHSVTEIQAQKIKIIDNDDAMQCEM